MTTASNNWTKLALVLVGLLSFDLTPRAVEMISDATGVSFGEKIAPASDEANQTIKTFRPAPGLQVDLFASEPAVAQPVSFTFDAQGRCYVAETFRHSPVGAIYRLYEGVLDIRSHLDWLADDLASRTVADRVTLLRQRLGADAPKMEKFSERVQMLEDRDGDGFAERSTVFAAGFNHIESGLGAGVLARDGKVYYTCIPNLWSLADRNRDGVADQRKSVSAGYGVHISFIGHDLHGLKMGPDGRLYFSIGDRGFHVTTQEGGVLDYPDEGAVLRCWPDGSKLEVYAHGLRNPQELAWNEQGDFFTGDNNSDGGDRARWVYLVEGGDSGWRIGWQHINQVPRRGPWNTEKMWLPRFDGQAAEIVPPIANIGYGPSGIAFYPGTGLPDSFNDHFFLCDFRGGAASAIHSFTVKPKGAAYELSSFGELITDALPTDIEFGVEGGAYFSDWVQGWNKTGKGRIYRIHQKEVDASAEVQEVKHLLGGDWRKRSDAELAALLGQVDQRVRLEAQFELVRRGNSDVAVLQLTATNQGSPLLARLHAIWGIGQRLANGNNRSLATLEALLRDSDDEVAAQAAKTLGEAKRCNTTGLILALSHPNPRVRFFAAQTLALHPSASAVPAISARLALEAWNDPWQRHALVRALSASASSADLKVLGGNSERGVRLGSLLALRLKHDPGVADFLSDPEPWIALQAARAIHDGPIPGAMEALARHATQLLPEAWAKLRFDPAAAPRNAVETAISSVAAETPTFTPAEQWWQRVINACLRVGTKADADALAALTLRTDLPEVCRLDAILALGVFAQPPVLDRATSQHASRQPSEWHPTDVTARVAFATTALKNRWDDLLLKSGDAVAIASIQAARRLNWRDMEGPLAAMIGRASLSAAIRIEALQTLGQWKSTRLHEAIAAAELTGVEALHLEAMRWLAIENPGKALERVAADLASPKVAVQRQALRVAATLPGEGSDLLLAGWLRSLDEGKVAEDLQLDVLDAAAKKGSPQLLKLLQAHEGARPKTHLALFAEALHGGDAAVGRKLFYERADIFCSRCHAVAGEGGGAGPSLTGIGLRQSREYLAESILFPNAKIAAGWENVVLNLKDDTSVMGMVLREDATAVVLNSPEDGEVKVPLAKIRSRQRALSAMPEEFRQVLTKQELRDLVEFLSTGTKEAPQRTSSAKAP